MGPHHSAGDGVDRRAAVTDLIAAQAVAGESSSTVVLLNRLCRAATRHLAAEGAAVGLMSDSGSAGVAASADPRSTLLDELQFSLGEGPSHHAFALRRPVLVADLGSPEGQAWPLYSAGALEAGVGAVFAFPLHVGATSFGVFTIYTSGGPISPDELSMALTFAEIATEILLDGESRPADGSLHPGVEAALGHRAEIYQAQGVLTVKLDISLAESLVRMRAHAFSTGQSLAELAALIMSGDVDLSPSASD